MRPADRLFEIVLALGRGKLLTAKDLAERFGVSERTIYRDVRDLISSGVPVEGEAGVGYRMRPGYQVPPLMFDAEELQVLAFGAQVARVHGDASMFEAAERALAKLDAALPPRLRDRLDAGELAVPDMGRFSLGGETLATARDAIGRRRRLYLDYADRSGDNTERIIWPLSLAYWGASWTLGGWCELRQAFRTFRLDRIKTLNLLTSEFPDVDGRRLADYVLASKGGD